MTLTYKKIKKKKKYRDNTCHKVHKNNTKLLNKIDQKHTHIFPNSHHNMCTEIHYCCAKY